MRIQRDMYLDKLIARKHNGMVKVVTGVRRCGKSYLLFELFMEHLIGSGVPRERIIDVQLDDRKNKALRNPDACDAYVRERVGVGQHYVMIDEVQLMPDFEDVLLGFLHRRRPPCSAPASRPSFRRTGSGRGCRRSRVYAWCSRTGKSAGVPRV